MKVWKYEVQDETLPQTIAMPTGAKFLSAHVQNGKMCVWILVDPDKPLQAKEWLVAGTGDRLERQGTYRGTFLLQNGHYVLHLFELD